MRRPSPLQLVLSALLLGAALVLARGLELRTDVTAFMPGGGDPAVSQAVRQMADSELSRTMVLMVGAHDPDVVPKASVAFEAALHAEPAVAQGLEQLTGGPPQGSERAIYDLYHPRRFAFFADSPEAVRRALSPEALGRAAEDLKHRLSQPMSPLLARLAPSDPLLTTTQLFERMQESQGRALGVKDGRFVTEDGLWAVLFASTRARAFDSAAQAPIVSAVEQAFAQTNQKFGGQLRLQQSAVNRVAVRTEQTIRGDIERVSILSMVSLLVVLLSLFRSLRLAALAALPIGAGVLTGVAACALVYGHVHGITLAFGASLIGVAIDYVIHLYAHHAECPSPAGPQATLRALLPSLITGAVTTLVGFMALAFAGFPGLQQVSLFASVGIVFALLTTCAFLPALLPTTIKPVPFRSRVSGGLHRLLNGLRTRRRLLWVLPGLALAFAAFGLPQARLNRDLMSMAQVDEGLAAEETAVRDRVARFDQTRFIVSTGAGEEAALQTNDAVARAAQASVDAGELSGFRSLATLLPSAHQQQTVARAFRHALGDGQVLVSAFERDGFRAAALAPFLRDLQSKPPPPLTFADLQSSPLAGAVQPFRITLDGRPAFLTFLHGVQDSPALAARVAEIPGALYVDQGGLLRETYAAYEQKTAELIALGLLLVLVILIARYRSARQVFAAMGPALLGAAVTTAALAVSGFGLNLVSLTALLMVVSMGVDYGVFLVDSEAHGADHERAALLSVVMAALSTILGFGLLALSHHPLLASIGVTACVGVTSCLVLSPTALAIASPPARK